MEYFWSIYDQVYNFFVLADWSVAFIILKIVGWLVSLLLAILAAILLSRADADWWLRERMYATQISYGKTEDKKWEQIKARLKKGDEANLKLAVIEADNILDDIFKRMGLPGSKMEERMDQIQPHEMKSIDGVRDAHRVRNLIIHQPSYQLSQSAAEQAIEYFEAALKELEYLS